ncbi:MAG: RNA polymerase sporulation sigma factor SigH [Eubacteriales bacterium]|nr:RNA polymerase sporulation sigma factor SigH [Eubacteriales bacterium]
MYLSQGDMVEENNDVLKKLSDEELVTIAQSGNADAMLNILNRYKTQVLIKARGYFIAGGDQDDLMQEGLIGLVKAVRDYRKDRNASFSVFADLCIKRNMITAIRKASRLKHKPLNDYVPLDSPVNGDMEDGERMLLDIIQDDGLSLEDEVISRECMRSMEKYYEENLSPLEKEVLNLFLKGKSYQEISLLLSRTTKAVDNALQRIRKKTRLYLDREH